MGEKSKLNTKGRELSLKDVIDFKEWQKIQDNFSVITEVGLRTVDVQCKPITKPSREPKLCREILKNHPLKEKICGSCAPTFLGGRGVVDKNLSFICEAGLCNFVSPLRTDEGDVLGYLIVGPVVLVMRKPKEKYAKIAEELDVDLDNFWSALLEIKVISFQGVQSLVELIRDVAEYTIKLACQCLTHEKGVVMSQDSPKLSRLLNALLDVAFQVTGADIGSIMFFDKASKTLSIRASKGIPDEIVRTTKVGLGEGISGLAVQEKTPFLINDNFRDNRIQPYLNRPYISSSMVIPMNLDNRAIGVINLGALKTSSVRFNAGSMQLMNKLIDLASLAITPTK